MTNGIDPAERGVSLFLMTLPAGILACALFRLSRYVRCVSHSVIGFLTGIAVNIVLGRIPDLTGAAAEGSLALAKALDVLLHADRSDWASLAARAGALALLNRTRLRSIGALVALVAPTVVLLMAGNDSVSWWRTPARSRRGPPLPHLPDLSAVSLAGGDCRALDRPSSCWSRPPASPRRGWRTQRADCSAAVRHRSDWSPVSHPARVMPPSGREARLTVPGHRSNRRLMEGPIPCRCSKSIPCRCSKSATTVTPS